MEVLERVGDWFNGMTASLERGLTGMFGSSNERRVRQMGFVRDKEGNTTITPGSVVDRINSLEPDFERLSDAELKGLADKFRQRIGGGETLDDLLPEAFAAVRESGKRFLKMRHYDVQLVGGYILHGGAIAEMVTGEGKTLVSTLPAFLNALVGHVHIVTVNDYLAKRDMEWMGPLHIGLGLTVGAIQSQMSPAQRQREYACDITYGTNNEFGFDYLRDNMKPTRELQVQGPLDFAIVDEIDNILIDEARTPLIISGPAHDDVSKYPKANKIAQQLKRDVHFEVKEKEHTCHLTDEGVREAEELAGVESFYTAGNMDWPHLIDNALKAHYLYKRDVNYIVKNDAIVIIDEHTGRQMEGRQWSDGLHQAVEAKEGVRIKEETQTLATITLQNYFKLYKKLAGMTGTAMTEANEFWKIYQLDVVSVPTNMPLRRVNYPDVIYCSEEEKWDAVVDEVREVHREGRPILLGTKSIENSELLSKLLTRVGVKHNVLNAKYHEREAEIIAQAGRQGAVTIATNMAGRGTDIILGGNPEHMAWDDLKQTYESRLDVPKSEWDARTKEIAEREGMAAEGRHVAEVGGLHVIGTERHDSRRIDLQLRGRAGRQGDPGSSRFFLSLEDDLMRIFAGDWVRGILTRLGMQKGEAIESGMVTRRIEGAQKKVEERHFETRKNLLEYDEVMDEQRKRVYSYRQQILDGANCRALILDMIEGQLDHWIRHFLDPNYRWETCAEWARQQLGIELEVSDIRDMDREQMTDFLRDEAVRQADMLIEDSVEENVPEEVEHERERNWAALSKWANARYGLNTNDRELKKLGRDDVRVYLWDRAKEAIGRYDFSPIEVFLADDWGRRSLSNWLHQQYTLRLDPELIGDKSPEEVADLVRDAIHKLYQEKEVSFPVAVGMNNFMAERQSSGERYNRDGLTRWAMGRFDCQLAGDELKGKSRRDISAMLESQSRHYFERSPAVDEIEQRLEKVYDEPAFETNGHHDGAASLTEGPDHPEALAGLIAWANERFEAELAPADFDGLDRAAALQRLLRAYDARFRPELCQAERTLILDVLDSAWKDHLYYMDHLKSGIGLVGYAQKDPKVEYRREGMKAFEQMWDRIGAQVTGAIFRLDQESPQFVGSLWQVTSVSHAAPPPDTPDQQQMPEPGQRPQAVDPIRNRTKRVGRNDPCPCGSGRKFKKCCGKNG